MSGWYKQQRNLSERPWYRDSAMVHLYHYLKERAYVTDGQYEGQIIRRGSCPVTRSEMSELTGMSLRTIDRVLRRLVSYGEIIVRGNNRFSVVTVCDYDSCEAPESLFGSTDGTAAGTADGTTGGTTAGTTHLLTKEERRKKEDNILVSPYSSYKKERESENVALEVKKRYNKTFAGKLPECIRLTLPTRLMVEECIRRFGRQSIDLVFEQILLEPFSLGENKTGFIARFPFIFEPRNFQAYLERAQLRQKKQAQPQPIETTGSSQNPADVSEPQPTQEERLEKCRKRYQDMIALCEENPRSASYAVLRMAYQNGDLQKLGISWVPNQN